jgi:hypothetical protein
LSDLVSLVEKLELPLRLLFAAYLIPIKLRSGIAVLTPGAEK